jgi:hypothetical protein
LRHRVGFCSAVWRSGDVQLTLCWPQKRKTGPDVPDRFSAKPSAASLIAVRLSPRREIAPPYLVERWTIDSEIGLPQADNRLWSQKGDVIGAKSQHPMMRRTPMMQLQRRSGYR